MILWGLSRAAEWLTAEMAFKQESGYKGRGLERATSIKINRVSLKVMLETTKEKPENVWLRLGKEVEKWENQRRYLYERIKDLHDGIIVEEKVYKAMTAKP